MQRVAIVGGGYAGTAFAVHLSRIARQPWDITVVDPRERVGGGLAHSTRDRNHRLNAPDTIHLMYPDDDLHFRRWLESSRRLADDPQAWSADGRLYPRRGDFGDYLAAEFASHAIANPSGSRLTHIRSLAGPIERRARRFLIDVAGKTPLEVDRCVIAAGQESAGLNLPGLSPEPESANVVADPFCPQALARVNPAADVLIVGTGLTSADTVATLLQGGHQGHITCISRRGLRPMAQAPLSLGPSLWQRMAVQPPTFAQRHGTRQGLLHLMRVIRQDADERIARGEAWHGTIDEVRDAAAEIWQTLSVVDQRRFLRHLKPYYDVHRFRIPPQTLNLLAAGEARHQLSFEAGHIASAHPVPTGLEVAIRPRGEAGHRTRVYGALVSCAGFSPDIASSRNPFIRACLDTGIARPSALGRSLDADPVGRVIDADGKASDALYALGATALDSFGETPAAIFILRQVLRILPSFVTTDRGCRSPSS